MTRRAVLLALLLLAAPRLAAAQTAGTIVFDPDTYVNKDDCDLGTSVDLDWTVSLESGVAFQTGWKYQIYASGAAPTGTPAYCDTATARLVAGNIVAAGTTQSETGLVATDFAAAVNNPACDPVADRTIYVCVHLEDASGVPKGSATGTLMLHLRAPAQPAAPTVRPGDGCLYVSWSKVEATSTTPAAATYRAEAWLGGVEASASPETAGTTGTICGLSNDNGVYDVYVIAISVGGNETASPSTPGDPVPSDDFWTHYRNLGGQEEGGCSTGGGAGILALLGLLALRAAGRRRS